MPLPPRLALLMTPRVRPLIYLPAAVGLSFLVLLSIPLLSIPIAIFFMFAIPYWMGERRPRILLLVSLAMLFATAAAVASFFTWDLYRPQTPIQSSPDGVLTGGTVDPYLGDAGTTFTYRVLYTHPDQPLVPPRVNITSVFSSTTTLNLTMALEDPTNVDYASGVFYVVSTILPEGAHAFLFVVQLSDERWVSSFDASTLAERSRGPINTASLPLFGAVLLSVAVFTFSLVGIPLLLVIAIYAVRRRGRIKKGPITECPRCGQDWPPEAEVCPQCGHRP